MPDAGCSTTISSLPAAVALHEVPMNTLRATSMVFSADTTPSSAQASVKGAAPAAIAPVVPQPSLPCPVTYRSSKVQTRPPSNAAEFEEIFGHPPQMSDLERHVGLAGNGRYTAPDDELDGVIMGTTFEPSLAGTKPAYTETGFQFMPFPLRRQALTKAKVKASMTVVKFKDLAEEDGYRIWSESKTNLVVHSEQFGFNIELDATGNASAEANIAGQFLRNIYKEDIATINARKAAAAGWQPQNLPSMYPSSITATLLPVSFAAPSTPSPPRAIPALQPATLVVTEDSPEGKATHDEKAARGEKAARKEKVKLEENATPEMKAVSEEKALHGNASEEKDAKNERLPNEQSFDAMPPIEWPHEFGNPSYGGDDEDNLSAYESSWKNLIVYDPDPEPKRRASTLPSQTGQEATLSTPRKRKMEISADYEDDSLVDNKNPKRLQTTNSRSRAGDSRGPRFTKQERANSDCATLDNDHLQQAIENQTPRPSQSQDHMSSGNAPGKAKNPDTPRGTRREPRRRSKSLGRKSSHRHKSLTRDDTRTTNQTRLRSRSPERGEGNAVRTFRDRKEAASDRGYDDRSDSSLERSHLQVQRESRSRDGRAATGSAKKANRKDGNENELSTGSLPTPPASTKSTPPRTIHDAETDKSPLKQPVHRSKSAGESLITDSPKPMEQQDQRSLNQNESKNEPGDAMNTKFSVENQAKNDSNAWGTRAISAHTPSEKRDTAVARSGQKRSRAENENGNETVHAGPTKRAKKVMKTPAKQDGHDDTEGTDGKSKYTTGNTNGSEQHTSSRTEEKTDERARVRSKPDQENIEKQKKLEEAEQKRLEAAERKKRDIIAKIAERHANRAARARGGGEMARWVPRQMRQIAENAGTDTTSGRGGERVERSGRPR